MIEKYSYDELEEDSLPSRFYHPLAVYDDCGELMNFDNYRCITETNELFHIAQYRKYKAKKLKCENCGNDRFEVASEEWFTAIKCPNCEWELCIHEG